MEPFCRSRQPRSKAVLCPVSRSEQNNASALHEQRAQIAIPALADASEDRPITRRHLLRHQAKPSGKVTPPGKRSATANGCYHCAGDDRTDARNGHQLPAALGAVRQLFDLFSDVFNALIEAPPIATEILDDPDDAG